MKEHSSNQAATTAVWHVQRPLSEPVLESVEHELSEHSAPLDSHKRAPSTGNGIDHKGWAAWQQLREQLTHRVSERPGQAALIAVGAGALAALLLARVIGSKRGRH